MPLKDRRILPAGGPWVNENPPPPMHEHVDFREESWISRVGVRGRRPDWRSNHGLPPEFRTVRRNNIFDRQ